MVPRPTSALSQLSSFGSMKAVIHMFLLITWIWMMKSGKNGNNLVSSLMTVSWSVLGIRLPLTTRLLPLGTSSVYGMTRRRQITRRPFLGSCRVSETACLKKSSYKSYPPSVQHGNRRNENFIEMSCSDQRPPIIARHDTKEPVAPRVHSTGEGFRVASGRVMASSLQEPSVE